MAIGLSNQRVDIRNFTAAFRSLYDYISIVDPQSLTKAQLFISDKMLAISNLLNTMNPPARGKPSF
jgi:hypothetical protein